MLSGREMTTREPLDVDPEPREPFARCRDLSGLEGVLLAAGDVEGNGVSEFASDRGKIPSLGIAAVFVDEPGGAMHECCAAAAADRVAQVDQLGGANVV